MADGLSRIRVGNIEDEHEIDEDPLFGFDINIADLFNNEIRELDYENNAGYVNNNENMSTAATIHSAEEDGTDLIQITEKPINIYKNQIYLCEGIKERSILKIVRRKCQNFITVDDNTNLLEIMKKLLIDKGLMCIYCENINLFLKFQDLYKKYFSSNKNLVILRSTKKLVDVMDLNTILEIIKEEHLKNNHRGINEIFLEVREKYFYPNLLVEISKFINNCDMCNLAKHDRNPPKIPLNITETPNHFNDIVHMDIWFPVRNRPYLTTIDKFSKYGTIHKLKDRTWISILGAIKQRIQSLGKMNKLVSDGERCIIHSAVDGFLKENLIQFHQTTAYHKTGNSDVERFHGTLNEHLRLLNADKNSEDDIDERLFRVINCYNNTIHSTTKFRPIDFITKNLDKDYIKRLKEKYEHEKNQRITKLNVNKNVAYNLTDNIVKNRQLPKVSPKYKQLAKFTRQGNYVVDNTNKRNTKYYQTQIKRRYKFQN